MTKKEVIDIIDYIVICIMALIFAFMDDIPAFIICFYLMLKK